MFLNITDVTCLTLPIHSPVVNKETSLQSFRKIPYGFSIFRRSLFAVSILLGFCACTEMSEYDSYDQVYDVFGNMEHEEAFWQQIDTTHLLIAEGQYAQAKARLLKVRESIDNKAHQAIINTISHKINTLQREKGDAQAVLNREEKALDPYLHSTSTADLMLAYNLATSYITGLAKELESIKFPGALEKRKHIVFYKGEYRIRSYAYLHTASGKHIRSRFICDIKLHKDRKNFTVQKLEIRK